MRLRGLVNQEGKIGRNLLGFLVLVSVASLTFVSVFIYEYYQHLITDIIEFASVLGLTFLFVLVITPILIKLANKYNLMDKPSERKTQTKAIPLLGGVAIFLGVVVVMGLYGIWTREIGGIMIGSFILLLVGTIDDFYPLSSTLRLIAQFAAAYIVIDSGLMVSFMPDTLLGNISAGLITVIWILGVVNALNFLDGIDGLASGITAIGAFFFFLITLHQNQTNVSYLSAIIIGGCLAFLIYNFKPAKIYLGDGGSTFLGFVLATLALYGEWSSQGPVVAFGIPMLILGVLIFDMIYITISRIKNKLVSNVREWLDFTGRDHFHHRLLHLGFHEKEAVIFIYIISIILGLSALVLENVQGPFPVVVLMVQAILIFVTISFLMLVGRKLYVPTEQLKEILSDEALKKTNVDGDFISGDTLQKIIQGKHEVDSPEEAERLAEVISIMEELKKKYAKKFS